MKVEVKKNMDGIIYSLEIELADGSKFRLMDNTITKSKEICRLEVMLIQNKKDSISGALDIRPRANNVVDLIPSNLWYEDRKKK